ncbi:MAG: tRNA (adenosine(37)-N6)-threonylcarbamoyltransferase complex transferase subunit TsaD, partial [Patescibacteria group bacterium]
MTKQKKQPTILSIDTSCDDTSVAITQGLVVLSNVIASQTQLHKQYGGVFPTVAKQAHKDNIDPCISAALKKASPSISSGSIWGNIDAIAVTQGPGLAPALEVGIKKAKELAKKHNKKLIAVNHIEGHCLSPLATRNSPSTTLENHNEINPALSLVVSGGHSEFILIKKIGKYERLGWTIDDAAGECLDKVGRILGLGYPAGPVIEKFAKLGDEKCFTFPLPMTESKNFNLSFSGLKTFARNKIKELEDDNQLDQPAIYDFSASFQYAVFRHICYKLGKVLKKHPSTGQVWLGG